MAWFTHEFEGLLSKHGVGRSRVIWYQVLFMPEHLVKVLPFREHPRLRVRGEIVDIPVAGAWMPTGNGHYYFIVSPEVRKGTGARLGDMLDMRFFIDDQHRVDVPPTLKAVLDERPALRAVWESLTPGKRRGFAHQVAQAKSSDAVQRRIHRVLEALAAIL